MPIQGSLFTDHMENQTQDPFALQNKKLLKINMAYGQVWARTGSMVAYQGDVRFENKGSGGMAKLMKSAMTGEGVNMMSCTGQGELFVADRATEIQVFYLDNDTVSVNGANVLAFSGSIEWDIHRVQARGAMMTGGLYNVALRGTGYVAVTTDGEPVVFDVASAPTYADAEAVVLWTAGVQMDLQGGHRRREVDDARWVRRGAPDGLPRRGIRDGAALGGCGARRPAGRWRGRWAGRTVRRLTRRQRYRAAVGVKRIGKLRAPVLPETGSQRPGPSGRASGIRRASRGRATAMSVRATKWPRQ